MRGLKENKKPIYYMYKVERMLLLIDIHRYLGTTFLHPDIVIGVQLSPAPSPQPRPHPHIPKMGSSNNRLFRFSKPEWLNNSSVRNGGVYVAGALVSNTSDPPTFTLRTTSKLETPKQNEIELNPISTTTKSKQNK
jgi:hypothetical protein